MELRFRTTEQYVNKNTPVAVQIRWTFTGKFRKKVGKSQRGELKKRRAGNKGNQREKKLEVRDEDRQDREPLFKKKREKPEGRLTFNQKKEKTEE